MNTTYDNRSTIAVDSKMFIHTICIVTFPVRYSMPHKLVTDPKIHQHLLWSRLLVGKPRFKVNFASRKWTCRRNQVITWELHSYVILESQDHLTGLAYAMRLTSSWCWSCGSGCSSCRWLLGCSCCRRCCCSTSSYWINDTLCSNCYINQSQIKSI